MKKTTWTLLLVFVSTILFATNPDVLTLMNDMQFMGKVKKITTCEAKFKTDEGTFWVPATDIESVQFGNPNDKVLEAYAKMDASEKCLKGSDDAKSLHGKVGGHVALGALFGPFAVIGAAVAKPDPYRGKNTARLSKNENLFDDPAYLSCYKKKAKGKNIGNVVLGWGIWIAAVIIAGAAAG